MKDNEQSEQSGQLEQSEQSGQSEQFQNRRSTYNIKKNNKASFIYILTMIN
jgi:hypothetical protein